MTTVVFYIIRYYVNAFVTFLLKHQHRFSEVIYSYADRQFYCSLEMST